MPVRCDGGFAVLLLWLRLLLVRSLSLSLSLSLSSPPPLLLPLMLPILLVVFVSCCIGIIGIVGIVNHFYSVSSSAFSVILDSVFCSASSHSSPSHLVADQLGSLLPTHPPPHLSRKPCANPGIANTSKACAGLRTSPTLAVPARAREGPIRR